MSTEKQPYVRMVIGEVISDSQVIPFRNICQDELSDMLAQPGFIEARLLCEEGGRLMVMETVFATRDDAVRYHSSRAYRQLISKTQHLLVGDFVVKMFKQSNGCPLRDFTVSS